MKSHYFLNTFLYPNLLNFNKILQCNLAYSMTKVPS